MRTTVHTCIAFIMLTFTSAAQTVSVTAAPLSDTDIQLLRSDLQSGRNQVIADTMKFSDTESSAFWPIYRDYARNQQVIGDELVQLIMDYAKHCDSMDDPKATDMTQRMMNTQAKVVSLRQEYWPKFEKALGAKRAAKFYQVDNRLSLMINMQLASQVPLVP